MKKLLKPLLLLALAASVLSCTMTKESPLPQAPSKRQVNFPVTVTRDGKAIPEEAITKSAEVDQSDKIATMDKSRSFGLVGFDLVSGAVMLDNEQVSAQGGQYRAFLDGGLWDAPSATIALSAYYPFVNNVSYNNDPAVYSISFSGADTEAGPLVSKTVQVAVEQLSLVPLEFQHITNDIGYKICDVTTDPQLQGLIHLRKVVATNVASAGVFVNDLMADQGFWQRRAYYRNEVVFEGDAVVGVGMENEMFIGDDHLVAHIADSHRYYAIPDEIEMGKQCVELLYDVDSFTIGNFTYPALKDQKAHFMIYGVLPDNIMQYGRQYTFHLGLDIGKLYTEVNFSAAVSDWETQIYENNDVF